MFHGKKCSLFFCRTFYLFLLNNENSNKTQEIHLYSHRIMERKRHCHNVNKKSTFIFLGSRLFEGMYERGKPLISFILSCQLNILVIRRKTAHYELFCGIFIKK